MVVVVVVVFVVFVGVHVSVTGKFWEEMETLGDGFLAVVLWVLWALTYTVFFPKDDNLG